MWGTETMTVEEYMLNKLYLRGLIAGERERVFEFAKRELDTSFSDVLLERKQGSDLLIRDCWNTLASEYSEEMLDKLWRQIEYYTLTWCINQLRSRS